MDGLEFTSKLVEALAWPGVVCVLLLSQRRPLGKLIEGLKPTKVEVLGSKWEFEQKMATAEKLLADASAPSQDNPLIEKPKLSEHEIAFNQKLAKALLDYRVEPKSPPREVIENAWRKLYDVLLESLKRAGHVTEGADLPMDVIVKAAGFADEISKPVAASIQQLYRTLMLVRRDPDFNLSYEDADRYETNADQAVYALMFGFSSPVQG